MNKDLAIWYGNYLFGIELAFIPSIEAHHRMMVHLGTPNEAYPEKFGSCWMKPARTECNLGSSHVILIYVSEKYDTDETFTLADLIGTITHECVHAWDFCMELIGETNRPHEIHAYFIQQIVGWMINSYRDSRGPAALGRNVSASA